MGRPQGAESGDPCLEALETLIAQLDGCIDELAHARERSEELLRQRRSGRPWFDIVTAETRPLVVERVSTVITGLAAAGHTWRREQVAAMHREQISINRIAALFGVTRQRISALLREGDTAAVPMTDAVRR